MARNESKSYDSSIFEKANAPLASKLRELISSEKTKELAEYIGVSVQAINQYKQGTAYPKTENLLKIADFCNCSVDYLLGIAELPTRNATVQAIHEYTGLSESAIEFLHYLNFHNENIDASYSESTNRQTISLINRVLEREGKGAVYDEDGGTKPKTTLFRLMEQYITCSDEVTAKIGESSGHIITFEDKVTPIIDGVSRLFRAALLNQIQNRLDVLRNENGGADNGKH